MKAPPGTPRRGLHIGTISDAFIGILSAGQHWFAANADALDDIQGTGL